ncbi:FUSC family protein [Streptomyces benahoarensis]|uniref:FUSC family protein n=1 Tax=Streptomyces benahoarensis TaxID=2595054 RepID=A0A553YYQ5_9ACTN|nr:FUSC family protein [Streptomyces benahoarensis]TSB18594.1 FUSC family protein [Streptomyces benahoarensis]TSB34319.1 FUSC family protein [Streptomyces benahoarensis]
MTWLRALKKTARSGLTIERAELTPLIAVRGTVGVALVIGLCLWRGTPTLAVSSAFGAFAAGTVTFQRSWRPRPVLALAVAGGLALSTFLGYLAASHLLAFLLLLAGWTFLAGLAWAIGPISGVVGTQTVSIMLVTVTLPTSVLGALEHAALIAFGGLIQATLIIVFPVRPWGIQRDALADALAAEADYARRLRHDPVAPFDPQPLMDARLASAVTPRQAKRRPVQLHGPRGIAEQIRPVLASLADPVVGAPLEGPERDRTRDLLGAAATVLDAVAHAIRHDRPVRLPPEAMAALEVPPSGPVLQGAARRSAYRLIALLADAVESTDEPVESTRPTTEEERGHLLRPSVPRLIPGALRSLHRELRWSSRILRHAVRVSAVAAVGYLLGTALPFGHGYWVPLASVMVMRPDFGQTYARGVARFCGTLVGVTVAGALMALFHPGAHVAAALALCCVLLMYLLMHTGVSVTSACVAAYVVFLLGIAGAGWEQTVLERLVLTLVGGLLAMAAYALFPAWETPRLRRRLAEWLEANGRYALAVFELHARPAERRPRQVRDALLDSRAARAAWEESEERAEKEPVRHRGLSRSSAAAATTALATMGRVAMILEAHLPKKDAEPSVGATAFAYELRESLERATQAVVDREELDWSELRAVWERWDAEDESQGVALRGADLLLDALDDLAHALSRGPGGRNRAVRGRLGSSSR